VLSDYGTSNMLFHFARDKLPKTEVALKQSHELCRHPSYTSRRKLLTAMTAFARYY